MRVDISLDPKASHYCKHCGLTMKPTDLFDCSVCDGDMCEPRRRAKRLRDAERTAAGRKGCADRDRADAIAAARHVRAERPACPTPSRTMKKTKLELTWIGKDETPNLEPRILIEEPEKSYVGKKPGLTDNRGQAAPTPKKRTKPKVPVQSLPLFDRNAEKKGGRS